MRGRILWAATLASLMVALALGLGALAGAAPERPDSTWSVVASLPQDLYGAAAASNGTYGYAAGGYSISSGTTLDTFYRYNPVNEQCQCRSLTPGWGACSASGLSATTKTTRS